MSNHGRDHHRGHHHRSGERRDSHRDDRNNSSRATQGFGHAYNTTHASQPGFYYNVDTSTYKSNDESDHKYYYWDTYTETYKPYGDNNSSLTLPPINRAPAQAHYPSLTLAPINQGPARGPNLAPLEPNPGQAQYPAPNSGLSRASTMPDNSAPNPGLSRASTMPANQALPAQDPWQGYGCERCIGLRMSRAICFDTWTKSGKVMCSCCVQARREEYNRRNITFLTVDKIDRSIPCAMIERGLPVFNQAAVTTDYSYYPANRPAQQPGYTPAAAPPSNIPADIDSYARLNRSYGCRRYLRMAQDGVQCWEAWDKSGKVGCSLCDWERKQEINRHKQRPFGQNHKEYAKIEAKFRCHMYENDRHVPNEGLGEGGSSGGGGSSGSYQYPSSSFLAPGQSDGR